MPSESCGTGPSGFAKSEFESHHFKQQMQPTKRRRKPMPRTTAIALALTALLLPATPTRAADDAAAAALAAESEAYCATTVNKERTTPPSDVIAKVNEACALLEKEGTAAFPKFQGKNSPFIYQGTYIWVHTLGECRMLMHPIKYKLNGNVIVGVKDTKGKRLFAEMNALVREKGEGWVEYYWPKPGADEAVRKISFVKKCKMPDGVEVVVGSGLYNGSDEDIAKLELN
jgi:signal transduction histidine kinase